VPFHPFYTMKDLFGLIVFLIPFAWFAFFAPDIFGHPDNYIQANSLQTPADIVPEWYLRPFYAILRAIDFNFIIDSKLLGVIFFAGSLLVLFFVPWLDTSKVRSGRYRPWFRWAYWLFVINFVMLTWYGSVKPDVTLFEMFGAATPGGPPVATISKLSVVYYFVYFLVLLPLLGRFEKPKPLPNSISEAVLKSPRMQAAE
jgi:ubiquinol-cytochrome c reductase cytochrome b subunit